MKKLYVYALTCDSNFAPCIENGIFTLACCKGGKNGGMRKSIQNSISNGDEVWVLGVCSSGLNDRAKNILKDNTDRKYKPLYFAKINNMIDYIDYFSPNSKYIGRKDQKAYIAIGKQILSNDKYNPHANNDDLTEKDINGQYVLLSKDFSFLGNKCGSVTDTTLEKECRFIFKTENGAEKSGIDKHSRGYIIYEDLQFDFEEYLSELRSITKNDSKVYHLSDDDSIESMDDENDFIICKCGGNK